MRWPPSDVVTRLTAGTLLLLRPDVAAADLGAATVGGHSVLRALGARQVLQAALSARGLGPRGRTVAATVDGLHAASCLGLAWRRPDLRTPAYGTRESPPCSRPGAWPDAARHLLPVRAGLEVSGSFDRLASCLRVHAQLVDETAFSALAVRSSDSQPS